MAKTGYQRPEPASVSLSGTITHRGTSESKDFRYVNVLPEILVNAESQEGKIYVMKRDGSAVYSQPPGAAAVGRGLYYWAETGKIYSVFGNKLYANTSAIQTLNTSTGRVGFSENQGGTKYLFVEDGTDSWYVNSSDTVAQVVDAQFPAATAGFTENVDGYTLVINTSDGAIYNSDLDDPTSWSSEFIAAEIYPDETVAITRYRNMFVAFGRESSEFFYNAGNTSGSPFSRAQQYSQEVGIAEANTLARTNDMIFFVGQDRAGSRAVYTIKEDRFQKISPTPYNRILNYEDTNIANADGMICVFQGHTCYMLTLTSSNRTLCYDVESDKWWEFENTGGDNSDWIYSTPYDEGHTLVQHRTNGIIYTVLPTVYQDNGTNFTSSITTNLIDFGTNRRKFGNRLEILGDYATSSTNLSINWSDDDYQNWSTARTVDMSGHMFLRNIGSFRRRAFKLAYTDNYAMRLEKMEIEFDVGDW